jgi:hypothetical protein
LPGIYNETEYSKLDATEPQCYQTIGEQDKVNSRTQRQRECAGRLQAEFNTIIIYIGNALVDTCPYAPEKIAKNGTLSTIQIAIQTRSADTLKIKSG